MAVHTVQGCGEGQIAGLYDLGRTLGTGHFSVVKLARHVFTGQRVAVEVINKSKLAGGAVGQLLQEVHCMNRTSSWSWVMAGICSTTSCSTRAGWPASP
uniref:Protein kinase domain-containing protein n=1 Tax=Strigops habroptila TaxID=2489341 RepID=A0A672THZ8_STRHB